MEKSSIEETGRSLVVDAHIACEDDDMQRAKELLAQVSDTYWNKYFPKHLQDDVSFRKAVADLVEIFGVVDFRLLRKSGIEA